MNKDGEQDSTVLDLAAARGEAACAGVALAAAATEMNGEMVSENPPELLKL